MCTEDTAPGTRVGRVDGVPAGDGPAPDVGKLVGMALRALPHMYRSSRHELVHTVRRDESARGGLRQEGVNLRYAAMVGLGASRTALTTQRHLFAGLTADQLIDSVTIRASSTPDLGAVALAAWAAAEVRSVAPKALFERLVRVVKERTPQSTVECAWTLTALIAARRLGDFAAVAEYAAERLLSAQRGGGLFPHAVPSQSLSRYRAHVGCYADQVYPIQALARYFAATDDRRALDAANLCAAKIVELQGPAGQWWWHYDVRTNDVVEGYPVYSVHQHAMGPMALFDLYDAGGADHLRAIVSGISWLHSHPEVGPELLDHATGVVWRKVGRREPGKTVRSVRSVATALSPRLRLSLLDRIFQPNVIDYECRPYELGWLLYAWHADSVVSSLSDGMIGPPAPESA